MTLSRFGRLRQSFRERKENTIRDVRQTLESVRKVPRWLRIVKTVYHDYGLKHVCLILLLILYQFVGATVFYFCEAEFDEDKEYFWNISIESNNGVLKKNLVENGSESIRKLKIYAEFPQNTIEENRTHFVSEVVSLMFNNTEYLFFLTQEQTDHVSSQLQNEIHRYEQQLGIKYTDQKIKWDFWNAMLYAQTIFTTIGYGHLYPSTIQGRVFTMIYAIFGIPLVLSILDDLGKLLTKALKYPWWLLKCGCRRMFRYCTKQTMQEIRRLDIEDKRDLDIFDLPIPVAISIVIAWIFICSAIFCFWEPEWDYFVAFYFFFISLSTIGLGDITPSQPKYLLLFLVNIIIGLSLVSMCINLIQSKLERTYEAGQLDPMQIYDIEKSGGTIILERGRIKVKRRGSSLGVFRSSSSVHSLNKETIQATLAMRKRNNKSSQTILSFPSPSSSTVALSTAVNLSRMRIIPSSLSMDDVMHMVDTEDGDIIVLSSLAREDSMLSEISRSTATSTEDSSAPIVISKSFDTAFISKPSGSRTARVCTSLPPRLSHGTVSSLKDLEEIEEIEDQLAMSNVPPGIANSVHFRSRLSLIPEQLPSTVEEADEPSEDSHPLTTSEDVESGPIRKSRPFSSMMSYLYKREPKEKVTTQ